MRLSICNVIFFVSLLQPSFSFGAYEINSGYAINWLAAHQNPDGSWGASETEQFINTVETVQALLASANRNAAYLKGIAWLENHAADNSDFLARGVFSLAMHGDDLNAAVKRLEGYQDTSTPGHSGWGLSPTYLQSPLDTAIVLTSLAALGTNANVKAAIDYLKNSQLTGTDKGWAVGSEGSSDAFTTAMAIKALAPLQSQDSSLSVNIANGITTLCGIVNSGSPIYLQALTAHAAILANNPVMAQTLLNNLTSAQGPDGSWSGRVYDTALALRAFAAADGTDNGAGQTTVVIPDAGLRAAINASLGRNAMDNIDRAELAKLTELHAANKGISDLTGLEWAVNLKSADLRNNQITSTSPLNNLSLVTYLQLDGNPGTVNQYSYGSVVDAPHNDTWGVTCGDCHSYTLWWQYSPTASATNYGTIANVICVNCHAYTTHSSTGINPWSGKCVDCHSAHYQAQLDWRASNASDLYLVKGKIGVNFSVHDGQTTFDYVLTDTPKQGWSDPATWSQKNNVLPPSGLILVEDTIEATNTFAVLSATSTTISIKGGINPTAKGKTFGLIYGQLIKKVIITPSQNSREVKFFNPKDPAGGYTDSNAPATGICQVCHVNTLYWTGDGNKTGHYAGENCTDCHLSVQGF